MEDQFLTPAQVAEKLQVAEKTVTRWLNSGELKGVKFGRLWRIKTDDFHAFITERQAARTQ